MLASLASYFIERNRAVLGNNRKSISLTTCILDAAWIWAIGVEVTNLGNDTLTTYIDMLCIASALVGNQIWTYIQRELGCVRATSSKLGVYINLVTLTRSFHCALTICIIPIIGNKAIIIRSEETVLLIPFEFAFRGLLVSHAILLCTACIDIDKITVGIILISMIVVHILAFWRCLLRSFVLFCKIDSK